MQYCTKCLIPSTRPEQVFDENGVCNACLSVARKKEIDWDARKKELDGGIEIFGREHGWDGSRNQASDVGRPGVEWQHRGNRRRR